VCCVLMFNPYDLCDCSLVLLSRSPPYNTKAEKDTQGQYGRGERSGLVRCSVGRFGPELDCTRLLPAPEFTFPLITRRFIRPLRVGPKMLQFIMKMIHLLFPLNSPARAASVGAMSPTMRNLPSPMWNLPSQHIPTMQRSIMWRIFVQCIQTPVRAEVLHRCRCRCRCRARQSSLMHMAG
jgi:hypothetical protein